MSQHYWDTTLGYKPVTVTIGWDRPLQGFFLVVQAYASNEDDEGDILYSYLEDPKLIEKYPKSHGVSPEISYFVEKLESMHIRLPADIVAGVQLDRKNSVGNRHVWYNASGAITGDFAF
jgi:hypothetical protein